MDKEVCFDRRLLFSPFLRKPNTIKHRELMLLRRYVSRKTLYLRRFLIILIILAVVIFSAADYMLDKYADIVCRSSCSQYGEGLINSAVGDVLSEYELTELITVREDYDGLYGYSVNSELVNEISASLLQSINDSLSNELHSYVSVPVGAFTGISFLSGSGPDVKIDIYAVGNPKIELIRHFESAGINQSLFELYADISISFAAVMPTKSVTVTVNRQVLLAQNIVIGDVPQIYYPQS